MTVQELVPFQVPFQVSATPSPGLAPNAPEQEWFVMSSDGEVTDEGFEDFDEEDFDDDFDDDFEEEVTGEYELEDDEYGAEFMEQNANVNFGGGFGDGDDDDDDDDGDGDDDFGEDEDA
jgi:hypothetical protein